MPMTQQIVECPQTLTKSKRMPSHRLRRLCLIIQRFNRLLHSDQWGREARDNQPGRS